MILIYDLKNTKITLHTRQTKVSYKLKTCIVQTINSAYKGIFVSYTDKISVQEHLHCRYETYHQLNQWDSDTAQGCDYWYWSGTGWLGHMHVSPLWHRKKDVFQKSLFTKKKSLCLSMANIWPWFFLILWQGEVRVKEMFLWAEVELAACVPVYSQLHL